MELWHRAINYAAIVAQLTWCAACASHRCQRCGCTRWSILWGVGTVWEQRPLGSSDAFGVLLLVVECTIVASHSLHCHMHLCCRIHPRGAAGTGYSLTSSSCIALTATARASFASCAPTCVRLRWQVSLAGCSTILGGLAESSSRLVVGQNCSLR